MPYNPKAIADYFLDLAAQNGVELTPMKLQKLVYFANGWHLALRGEPLIDEQVQAWTHGPVIQTLYNAFRRYGVRPISAKAIQHSWVGEPWPGRSECVSHTPVVGDEPARDEFVKSFLDRIWDVYSKYSAIQLSNMTHEPGSPWHQLYTQYEGRIPRFTDIPTESIRAYFADRLKPKAGAS